MKKIRDNFECSDFISTTLLQGIQERTKQTSKALLDVGMMSDKRSSNDDCQRFSSYQGTNLS